MIRKQDILDRAAEWHLRPEVVEKDYVLGWLLAGLSGIPAARLWVFKGGTMRSCLTRLPTERSCIRTPTSVRADAELRSEWSNMLAHQLPALPDLDGFLEKLPRLLAWLDPPAETRAVTRLSALPMQGTETTVRAPGIRYWGSSSPLETIRFAATNRLILEFGYHGQHRRVEPYAVRQAQTGNVLLYGWELASGHIKAFKIPEMINVRSSGSTFSPRYVVEISAFGPVVEQSVARQSLAPSPRSRSRPTQPVSRTQIRV